MQYIKYEYNIMIIEYLIPKVSIENKHSIFFRKKVFEKTFSTFD